MKMTEYPAITELTSDNILITDGNAGTKKIGAGNAVLSGLHLASVENHRLIFRGKSLGSSVTATQLASIQAGTFKDLWLGDYWTINDIDWYIVDFDYWYRIGRYNSEAGVDEIFNNHHLVIMPYDNLYNAQMNASDTTDGGYAGSKMYTANLKAAKTTVQSAFGSAVLTHPEMLCNAVSNGVPSGAAWYDVTVDLPSEIMLYGHTQLGSVDGYADISSPSQLAYFRSKPYHIKNRNFFWLRDIVSSTRFAYMTNSGATGSALASSSHGVRPVFAIG